jgi:hypothetical protein
MTTGLGLGSLDIKILSFCIGPTLRFYGGASLNHAPLL